MGIFGKNELYLNDFAEEIRKTIYQLVEDILKDETKQIKLFIRISVDNPYSFIDGIKVTKTGKVIALYEGEEIMSVCLLDIVTLTKILDRLQGNFYNVK